MHRQWLNENWTLRPLFEPEAAPNAYRRPGPAVPAQVPGCVHTDLFIADIIVDPFGPRGEQGCEWVSRTTWEYRCIFTAPEHDTPKRSLLKFQGIVGRATVVLNSVSLGSWELQNVPWNLDATESIQPGENELIVRFDSPYQLGAQRRAEYFAANNIPGETELFDERAFFRNAPYYFGWDWGPVLPTVGFAGPIELVQSDSYIDSLQVTVAPIENNRWRVIARAEIFGKAAPEFSCDHQRPDSIERSEASYIATWEITSPDLWWPNGSGNQPLSQVECKLPNGNAQLRTIAFRTVALNRQPDALGENFQFVVNGEPLWMLGANWIPNDVFPNRISGDEIRAQLQRWKALGANMLRIWGGGMMERPEFYDACDALGILIWHDFPYACGYVPEDPRTLEAAQMEAASMVQSLSHHPSVCLWCGNNENHQMWHQQWGTHRPSRFFGQPIYEQLLPKVVEECDPIKPYIISSPTPNQDGQFREGDGDHHYWDVWHGRGTWIGAELPSIRFCSEFGFASWCEPATLADQAWDTYNKTGKSIEMIRSILASSRPEPHTQEEWLFHSQIAQRDALRHIIEELRWQRGCSGALLWQANDCWPTFSWAVEDYSRLLKPAGYELARLFAPCLIAIRPGDQGLEMRVQQAGVPSPHQARLTWFHSERNQFEFEESLSLPEEAYFSTQIQPPKPNGRWVLRAEIEGRPDSTLWVSSHLPKEHTVTAPKISLSRSGTQVTFHAEGLAHDFTIRRADHLPLPHASIPGLGTKLYSLYNDALSFESPEPTDWIVRGTHWRIELKG